MADHMFLKVPNCGEHWKIELRTSPRRDRMWLEKGWEEFASFYLLDQGDMATFSFEGEHSHFHELPAAAVKKYGHQMGDHIFLKVPNWKKLWKVKLSKSPCGNHMWLEEGWKAFTQFYLLEEENEVSAMIISSGSSGDEQENEARVIAISSGSSGDEHEIEAKAK
ncbi:hypothetical protein ACLB2K_070883 [Fragaria x ananassa]